MDRRLQLQNHQQKQALERQDRLRYEHHQSLREAKEKDWASRVRQKLALELVKAKAMDSLMDGRKELVWVMDAETG